MQRTLARLVLFVGVLGVAQRGFAADQPLLGTKLLLQKSGTKEKLVLVLKDPAVLFPSVGSADDPGTGTPGGATIEIFSANEGSATLTVPAGLGKPGWKTKIATRSSHKYINPTAPAGPSPVRSMLIQQAKKVTLTAKSTGVPLAVASGAVGIRITTGGIRNCAFFGPASVRTQDAGRFLAKNAVAPADCDDATLGAPPPPPCGDAPTCDGSCGPGEECGSTGGGQCGCLPAGSSPCGDHLAPACGGDCPGGQACNPLYPPISQSGPVGCACNAPSCGNGFAWGIDDFGQGGCFPISCSGTYPTCGGACGEGGVCSPLQVTFVSPPFTMCICAEAAPCCGGGYECSGGDVCTNPGACSCSPP